MRTASRHAWSELRPTLANDPEGIPEVTAHTGDACDKILVSRLKAHPLEGSMHKIKIILGTGDKYKINFGSDNGQIAGPSRSS